MQIDETSTTETGTENSETTTSQETTSTEGTETKSSDTTATTSDDVDDKSIDLGAKTDDDDGDKTTATDEDKGELFGAPAEGEKYEIAGLPEGMQIDDAALEAAAPVFRELGLSSAGASKVALVYAEKVLPGVVERAANEYREGVNQQIAATRKQWEGEAIDAIGGKTELKTLSGDKIDFEGKSVKQVRQDAARALDRLAPAGFREYLEETGLGAHPALIAFAYKAGMAIAEDSDFAGGGGAAKEKTRTQKYYNR